MCSFPIFQYPILAAKLIFEELEPCQLFEMTGMSKRLEKKMKEASVRCERHSVSFTRHNPSICLQFTEQKQLEIVFNLPFPKNAKIRYAQFKDLKFSYATTSLNQVLVCPEHRSLFTAVYHFYDHLAGLFRTPMIGQLNVDVDVIKNLIGLLAIPEFSRCQTLQLIGEEMAEEDAQYIQDKCQIHETLSLNGKVGRREQHWKMYEIKNLIVKTNNWIDITDLMKMKCQNIFIDNENAKIRDQDLIEFVKKWKKGETNENIKTLYVTFTGDRVFSIFPRMQHRQQQPVQPIPAGRFRQGLPIPDAGNLQELVLFEQQGVHAHQLHHLQGFHFVIQDGELNNLEQQIPWREIERKRMNLEKHSRTYIRGEKNYSKLIDRPDTIELDDLFRDVERVDGTFASIRILMNTFQMVVWPDNQPNS